MEAEGGMVSRRMSSVNEILGALGKLKNLHSSVLGCVYNHPEICRVFGRGASRLHDLYCTRLERWNVDDCLSLTAGAVPTTNTTEILCGWVVSQRKKFRVKKKEIPYQSVDQHSLSFP
jgi:hypothetical protein